MEFFPSQVDLSTNLSGSSINRSEVKALVVTLVKFLQKNGDRWSFKKADFINSFYFQDSDNEAYTVYPTDTLNVLIWMRFLTEKKSIYEPTYKLLAILEEFKMVA